MALERFDRIKETTTTTGTGTVSLSGTAPVGFLTFVTSVTSLATVRYFIESTDLTEWEVGEGVFTDGTPDTLSRVTVFASSNAGSLVNFSAGTKTASLSLTAQDIPLVLTKTISLPINPVAGATLAESFGTYFNLAQSSNNRLTIPFVIPGDWKEDTDLTLKIKYSLSASAGANNVRWTDIVGVATENETVANSATNVINTVEHTVSPDDTDIHIEDVTIDGTDANIVANALAQYMILRRNHAGDTSSADLRVYGIYLEYTPKF